MDVCNLKAALQLRKNNAPGEGETAESEPDFKNSSK